MASTKHTLLVVDDEASARYSLRRVFESEYTVIEAESVAAARVRLRQARPVVVRLDYSMPGEDGLVLLRELAGTPDAPAVVMATAQARNAWRWRR